MKLWLLKRLTSRPAYDVSNGMVIRAETEDQARDIARWSAGDEGQAVWVNSETSSCEEITAHGAVGMILLDFNAG